MAVRANIITPGNIVETAFTRRIQDLHFKDSDIAAGQFNYVQKILGVDFLDYVLANLDDFEDLITGYITPVISYGVYSMNFYRLFAEVTDRGINQFNNTGSTQIDTEGRTKLFAEINNTLNIKISMMIDFCNEQSDEPGYSLLVINTNYQDFDEFAVFGKTLKNNYI